MRRRITSFLKMLVSYPLHLIILIFNYKLACYKDNKTTEELEKMRDDIIESIQIHRMCLIVWILIQIVILSIKFI